MKPKSMRKKLVLNKETIADMMSDEMRKLLAGGTPPPPTWGPLSCETGCNTLYYNQQCPPELIWACGGVTTDSD